MSMDAEKQKAIDNMNKVLKAYEQALDNGKRNTEIIGGLEQYIKGLDHAVSGTKENPLMGLIDLAAGQRQVPISNEKSLDTLGELRERMVTLLQECREEEFEFPCNHDWLIEKTSHSGGGIFPTPPYIDMHCSDCESSITSYDLRRNYPVWLRYLTPDERAQVPLHIEYELDEEEGKYDLRTTWEDIHKLVDLCLEHKIEFQPEAKTLSALVKEGIISF